MQESAILVLKQPASTGQQWVLDRPVITLGRWTGNDVVFIDRGVSRNHAQIRCEGRQYVLEDLGSTNGTYVNDRLLDRAVILQDGDEIRLGPGIRLAFVDAESTLPIPIARRRRGVELDMAERRVWVQGVEIVPPLSPPQLALLKLLAGQPGRVFSRDEIIATVWPDEAAEGIFDSAIDALVHRVRQRLAEADPDTNYIVAVRGHGFKLEVPNDDE